jgi:hypothetical protein
MASVYRKTLKGMDELTFKSSSLPLRLRSYLLTVDGMSSTDELAAKNPHLPSMEVILNGLMQQGYIEPVSAGAAPHAPPPRSEPARAAAVEAPRKAAQASVVVNTELEELKAMMVRDVSSLLGNDAAPVIKKIQNCATRDELFSTMMGIKKIVTLYVNRAAGEKFAARYDTLSS